MRAGKIVAIVFGVLLIIVGLVVLTPGVILLSLHSAADNRGFFTTPDRSLESSGYALTTSDIRLDLGTLDRIPGGARIEVQAQSDGGKAVFVGIGPTDEVTSYLSGVAFDKVTNVGYFSSDQVHYVHTDGGAPATAPGQQTFWVAQQEGAGFQDLQWELQSGDWTAVVMNADGSSPVSVSVKLGAKLGIILPLGIGLTVGGVVLLAVGIFLVVWGARRPRKQMQPGYGYPGAPPGGPQQPYGQPPYGQQAPPYAPYAPPPYQTPPQTPAAGDAPEGQPPTSD